MPGGISKINLYKRRKNCLFVRKLKDEQSVTNCDFHQEFACGNVRQKKQKQNWKTV